MLNRAITGQEIQTDNHDGIVCLRGLFNADLVERMGGGGQVCSMGFSQVHARARI